MARNANSWGMLHRAVRLIYYARDDLLRGARSWQMLSALRAPGFGIVSQQAPEQRFLIYWLYWLFNRHLGHEVVAIDGTAPYDTPAAGDDPLTRAGEQPAPLTPVLATRTEGGKTIYLVTANGCGDSGTTLATVARLQWSRARLRRTGRRAARASRRLALRTSRAGRQREPAMSLRRPRVKGRRTIP